MLEMQGTCRHSSVAHLTVSRSAVHARAPRGVTLRGLRPNLITPFVPVNAPRCRGHASGSQLAVRAFFNFGKASTPGLSDNCWEQGKQKPKYPALNKDTEADVVIVGAGIVGLTAAYNLTQAGEHD